MKMICFKMCFKDVTVFSNGLVRPRQGLALEISPLEFSLGKRIQKHQSQVSLIFIALSKQWPSLVCYSSPPVCCESVLLSLTVLIHSPEPQRLLPGLISVSFAFFPFFQNYEVAYN